MIKEQKGWCGIFKDHFLPDDQIYRYPTIPRSLMGKPSFQCPCCSSLLLSKENQIRNCTISSEMNSFIFLGAG